MEYRNPEHKLLLELIASLTLADHMGDVSSDVYTVLKRLDMQEAVEAEWEGLIGVLGKMGVTTLYGTSLGDD